MRCAASLHSLKLQRIFLGGMPPRIGSAMCSVAFAGMAYEDKVEEGEVKGEEGAQGGDGGCGGDAEGDCCGGVSVWQVTREVGGTYWSRRRRS
jgi:hypothetical protein